MNDRILIMQYLQNRCQDNLTNTNGIEEDSDQFSLVSNGLLEENQ